MESSARRFEVWVIQPGQTEPSFYCSAPTQAKAEAVIRDEIHVTDAFHGRPERWADILVDGRSLDDFAREARGAISTEDLRSFPAAEAEAAR